MVDQAEENLVSSYRSVKTEDCFTPTSKLYDDATIRIQDLSFSYKSRQDVRVLDEVSLSIQKNQISCIVGKSGSGKSTLAALLCGLYHPDGGKIIYGQNKNHLRVYADEKLSPEKVELLHDLFGVVEQSSTTLFSGTIAENIAYGNVSSSLPSPSFRFKLTLLLASRPAQRQPGGDRVGGPGRARARLHQRLPRGLRDPGGRERLFALGRPASSNCSGPRTGQEADLLAPGRAHGSPGRGQREGAHPSAPQVSDPLTLSRRSSDRFPLKQSERAQHDHPLHPLGCSQEHLRRHLLAGERAFAFVKRIKEESCHKATFRELCTERKKVGERKKGERIADQALMRFKSTDIICNRH